MSEGKSQEKAAAVVLSCAWWSELNDVEKWRKLSYEIGCDEQALFGCCFPPPTSSGVLVGRSALDLDRNAARLCWWERSRAKEVNHYLCRRNLLPKFYDLSVMCVCPNKGSEVFFWLLYGFTFDGRI